MISINNSVIFKCFGAAIAIFFLATSAILLKQNMALRQSLAEAASQLEFSEQARSATEGVLTDHLEKVDEIKAQRKELQEKLEAASCLSGPAYIDALVELLDNDHKDRCH